MTGHINCSVPKWNISTNLEGQKINLLREGQVGEGGGYGYLALRAKYCFFYLNEPSLSRCLYHLSFFLWLLSFKTLIKKETIFLGGGFVF